MAASASMSLVSTLINAGDDKLGEPVPILLEQCSRERLYVGAFSRSDKHGVGNRPKRTYSCGMGCIDSRNFRFPV